ncbi:MAG TPA: ABC transporter ATP-binding protein, partial [Actinomycetales bacterium]
ALGWVLGELPRSVVGWDRVDAVLRAEGGLRYGGADLGGGGAASVELQHVAFAHVDSDGTPVPALTDVTFEVAAGTTVALVGPTGSGKSTLTALLVRLFDPDTGSVLVDGADLREVQQGGVAAAAALVAQQTFLFDDSVRGNITLGDQALQDPDDRRVWAALRLAQADGFVAALPHGLDTEVGERGTSLSGGQRQRIALARALVRRPRLLVLDDATSAVDPTVEAAILAGLRETGSGTTVVVVAYRKATIALADEVVLIEHGRVVERGTHTALSLRSERYRRLVDAYEREAAVRAAALADDAAEVSA